MSRWRVGMVSVRDPYFSLMRNDTIGRGFTPQRMIRLRRNIPAPALAAGRTMLM